jgi:purine-binding chemotaxis protein CheW
MSVVARHLAPRARWVAFLIDGQRYALPLESVTRVVRAAEVTALPLAPQVVAGVIDVGGRSLPVFDLRRRLRLRERALAPSDQFIIARTSRREVVLIVDAVPGLIDAPTSEIVDPAGLAPGLGHLAGLLALPDGMVLIEDLELFLSPEEERALDTALRQAEAARAR